MSKIVDRLFPSKKNAPKLHVAYAISVCEFLLNLLNQQIQITESTIKSKIIKYLRRVVNKEKLSSSDEDEARMVKVVSSDKGQGYEKGQRYEEGQDYEKGRQEEEDRQEEGRYGEEGQDFFNLIIDQNLFLNQDQENDQERQEGEEKEEEGEERDGEGTERDEDDEEKEGEELEEGGGGGGGNDNSNYSSEGELFESVKRKYKKKW